METRASRAVHLRHLTPMDFLERSARVYPEKTAVIYDDLRRTYPEMLARVYRFANLLRSLDVHPGDRVAVLLPNAPQLLEAHFAVPLAGAQLCALNIRLSPSEISHILAHCGATVVIYDGEFEPLLSQRRTEPQLLRIGPGAEDAQDFEIALRAASAAPLTQELQS